MNQGGWFVITVEDPDLFVESGSGLYHGNYMRTHEENQIFSKKQIRCVTALDLIKCLQQITKNRSHNSEFCGLWVCIFFYIKNLKRYVHTGCKSFIIEFRSGFWIRNLISIRLFSACQDPDFRESRIRINLRPDPQLWSRDLKKVAYHP